MRYDGSIERWDELSEALRTKFPAISRLDEQQRTSGSSSVSRFWFLLEKAFIEHQTWFLPAPDNPHILYFPFAWYLERGMEIRNVTTNATYKVKAVIERELILPHGEIRKVKSAIIDGANPPKKVHRLRFPDENYVVLRPSRGRSFEETANFENLQTEEYGAWNNVVTYYLTRREAGSVDARPFGRHRERRPRHRSLQYDKEIEPEYELRMRGQAFDNIAQFDCWAKDTTEADLLVDYFEQFMSLWTGVIEYNGIERIWFWGRGMDVVESRWRNDITSRSLQYYFRTESVDIEIDYIIRSIEVAVRTSESLDDTATGVTGLTGVVEPTGLITVEIQES